MPRIAREGKYLAAKQAIEEWNERTGDGTSTYDVCSSCWKKVQASDEWPGELPPYNGEPDIPDEACIAVGDIEHPDYESSVYYVCALCGDHLTAQDE